MTIVRFKKWKIDCATEATRRAYAQIEKGGPEEGGCKTCQNFIAARHQAYPPEVRVLLEQLGIDHTKEAEVYHNCRLQPGLHGYGGWFHFVGFVDGSDAKRQIAENTFTFDLEPINGRFAIGFTTHVALVPKAFGDQPVIQVEFEAKIPWIIKDTEPEE